ncbi:MAG: 3-dehydroquinate synthase [Magnetococcales bacterium]|nr:3-dehydroquinate synthase [Magnetococcales bacterium]
MKNPSYTLTVELDSRSYEIIIGSGVLSKIGELLKTRFTGQRVAIITNETVAPLYLEQTSASLTQSGFQVVPLVLPDGEIHKTWTTVQRIFDHLIENRLERTDGLLALGGGVIGDMTGFAAATYLRGVPFAQIPTTLLAQVDASVGGKTGINHPLGKNLIGSFYQPCLVLMDVETLKTLPQRERLAGLAEIIKYGIIRNAKLFKMLENFLNDILELNPGRTAKVLLICCTIKAEIVTADEREQGVRALLNLGHTFGHAIESLTGYDTWLHGEAVAAGMVLAAELAANLKLCDREDTIRIRTLIQRAGLPVTIPQFPASAYLEAMTHDKKVADGKIRFVLPIRIGKAMIQNDVPKSILTKTLEEGMNPLHNPYLPPQDTP